MTHTTFGRYAVIEPLGSGGMADIYLAHDPRMDRQVVIKTPKEKHLGDIDRARFQREAKSVASLEYRSIVPIYDFDDEGPRPFLVMRYMSGGSLADQLKLRLIEPADVVHILEPIAAALDYVHDKGIIHRDIKPGNILFDDRGEAHLTDFGIAWQTGEETEETLLRLTMAGLVPGTAAYLSPEQVSNPRELTGRCDVYALGVVTFEMLTGQLPYTGDTALQLALNHVTKPIPSILELAPSLPNGIESVITTALDKDPANRYVKASDLLAAIEKAVASSLPKPSPTNPVSSPPPVPVITSVNPLGHTSTQEVSYEVKSLKVGQVFERRFWITRVLKNDIFAGVYLADYVGYGHSRRVILKLLNLSDFGLSASSIRQIDNAASLSHPNLLPHYYWGLSKDGDYYIATEYLEEESLRDLLLQAKGNGSADSQFHASLVMSPIAHALAYAHTHNISHTYLTPSTILVRKSGWDPIVCDLAFVTAYQHIKAMLGELTFYYLFDDKVDVGLLSPPSWVKSELYVGDPHYLAPEQMTEEHSPLGRTKAQMDIYAIGVMLYEMLSGRLPFSDDNALRLAKKKAHQDPPPLGRILPMADAGLISVVDTCLARDPAQRYNTASELAADLDRVLQTLPAQSEL